MHRRRRKNRMSPRSRERVRERLELFKRQSDFRAACMVARGIGGTLELRAMCALSWLGARADYDWQEIRRMLE